MDFSSLSFDGADDKDLALDFAAFGGYVDIELQALLFDHIVPPQDQVPALEFGGDADSPFPPSSADNNNHTFSQDTVIAASAVNNNNNTTTTASNVLPLPRSNSAIFNASQDAPTWDSQWFASFSQTSQPNEDALQPRHHRPRNSDTSNHNSTTSPTFVEPSAVLALADFALSLPPPPATSSQLQQSLSQQPSYSSFSDHYPPAGTPTISAGTPITPPFSYDHAASQSSSLSSFSAAPSPPSTVRLHLQSAPTQPVEAPATGAAAATASNQPPAGSGPVAFIPSTTKKSTTACKSLPAELAYPEHLIPLDAPIQSKGVNKKRAAATTAPAATSRKRKAPATPAPTPAPKRTSRRGARDEIQADDPAADDDDDHDDEEEEYGQRSLDADDGIIDPNELDFSNLNDKDAKRIKNTLSARKSRARKQAKITFLETRVNELEAANQSLEQKLARAQAEIEALRQGQHHRHYHAPLQRSDSTTSSVNSSSYYPSH
ncbi:hypothetical protein RI367_007382 [Sorochytrium milnesiophthora]